jgi:hypothetical protein
VWLACLHVFGRYHDRMKFHPTSHLFALLTVLVFGVGSVAVAADAERSPEDTVKGYLKAMQDQKFPDAYDYVSSTLRGGKGREEWAKEQQYIVQVGEVKIFGYKVYKAEIVGDTAKVPNILKSQDKYLNQLGLDEHEVYTLVKEDGAWRIDQQMLVEGADKSEYFPDE